MWTDTGQSWRPSQPLEKKKKNETETEQYQAVSFFSSNLLEKQKYYCIFCVSVCVCMRQKPTDNGGGGGDVISELHRTGQEVHLGCLLNMCSVVIQCCVPLSSRKRVRKLESLNSTRGFQASSSSSSHGVHEMV